MKQTSTKINQADRQTCSQLSAWGDPQFGLFGHQRTGPACAIRNKLRRDYRYLYYAVCRGVADLNCFVITLQLCVIRSESRRFFFIPWKSIRYRSAYARSTQRYYPDSDMIVGENIPAKMHRDRNASDPNSNEREPTLLHDAELIRNRLNFISCLDNRF